MSAKSKILKALNPRGFRESKDYRMLIVVLISLILVGAVILANLLSFSNIQNLITNQLKKNQMTETDHAANQMESHILRVKEELVTLSKFPITDTPDAKQCSGDIKNIHESVEVKMDSLIRADKDGNIVECSSPEFSSYLGLNIKSKDYFTTPKETNEPFITNMRQGTSQQIIISTPLFETTKYTPYPNFAGQFKGILFSVIDVNELYSLYVHPIIDPEKNFFILVDLKTGKTIMKSSSIGSYSEIKDSLPKGNKLDTIADFGSFGETIITSSDFFFGDEAWRLIVFTPLKFAGGEVSSVQREHVFSLGFVIVVIAGVLVFLVSIYRSREEVQQKLDKANVTLEELGIKIEIEKEKYQLSDIALEPNKVYLIKEDDENNAHELFLGSLNRGFAGLGIVREDPLLLKKKYNLKKTPFIWLNKVKVEGIPCETNINDLLILISEFVKKSERSVILIDRLDYVVAENNAGDVIRAVRDLKDIASANDCIVILSVNPELIDASVLKSIEAETIDLYGRHLKKRVDLSDSEMAILKYINEKNTTNKLASYKDITYNFKITKPTTRARINKLQSLGLVTVDQKGRFKSLKITSAGRKITE